LQERQGDSPGTALSGRLLPTGMAIERDFLGSIKQDSLSLTPISWKGRAWKRALCPRTSQ
jgi:hypothetical protein